MNEDQQGKMVVAGDRLLRAARAAVAVAVHTHNVMTECAACDLNVAIKNYEPFEIVAWAEREDA